jgi:uncharacterized RmlC-like cupin family protein
MCVLALLYWNDLHFDVLSRSKGCVVADMNRAENSMVERLGGFSTIRAGAGHEQWSAAHYQLGLSEKTVGSTTLSMNVARLPAGESIGAHIHDGYEVGLYVLQGRLEHRFGLGLANSLVNGPGDFIFVESGVPHSAHNLSDTEPVVVVVARTSSDEWARGIPYEPGKD